MLNKDTKTIIQNARDVLVGKVPNPVSQIDLITTAMIYKFMDDMDLENIEFGGKRVFFTDDLEPYAWSKLLQPKLGHYERIALYAEALDKLQIAQQIPELFRRIFKGAFLPFRDGQTLSLFLNEINSLKYDNSENLGDAFEFLLSVMGSQGDAGQFRTPRHIIDFIVDVVNPSQTDTILDPACGTAGFLISAYKHILNQAREHKKMLTPDEMQTLTDNICGYDISPDMVKLASVNLFLHQFKKPRIYEYDTLSSDDRWGDKYDIILANPPFMTPKGGIIPHNRFAVKSNRAEVLFVDYFMEHLSVNGKAGFIVPEGVIFQSGTAYKAIRKTMIDDNYLYAVVSLPSGVFNPYAGVKTSILLFDRELAAKTDKVLFVKIANDGFDLGAQRRAIKENDLPQATAALKDWQESIAKGTEFDVAKYGKCLLVAKAKIRENGEYNLTASRYEPTVDYSNCKYEMVKLGDVCNLVRGITYSKNEESDYSHIIVLRANNICLETNSLDLSELKYLTDSYSFDATKRLKKGDIFICLASGSKQHIGKVAFIDKDIDYLFGGFMGAIRSNEKICPKYLFNLLKSSSFNDYLCQQIAGVNINNLNQKILYNYEIPLPPLSVQEEIVKELDQYQAIIDGAQKVVDNWKPTFEINPNWEKVRIGDVCDLINGIAFKPNEWENKAKGGLPIVRIQNLNNENADFNYSSKPVKQDVIIENGQLLFSWSGSFGPHIWYGNKAILNQHIFKVLFDDKKWEKKFLYLMLKNIVSKVENTLHGGVGLLHITKRDLEDIEIYKTSLEEQKAIVAQIEQEEQYVEACKKLIELNKQKISAKIKSVWNSGEK